VKKPTTDDCGNQPRAYVLGRLKDFNIGVFETDEVDWYEIIDSSGDSENLFLTDPIPARMVIHLWRRFGCAAGMSVTDFVDRSKLH
jgi:hypothetical protein